MSAIVFDLDGTLIDSAPDLHAAGLKMLAAEGLPGVTIDQTRSFIGNGVPKLVERLMGAVDLPTDPERHKAMTESFLRFYNAEPALRTELYPGARAALEALAAQGHKLGLCTNKPEGPARVIVEAFGLDDLLPVIIGGDSLAVKKPDPAPLKAAYEALGAKTGIYVGDSEVDAATAQAFGVPFLFFTEGYRKSPVDQIPHTEKFDHFSALVGLVADQEETTA
ncbi:MAG: phosphoglycolate phosphatase [Mangrovicoccus sp.]